MDFRQLTNSQCGQSNPLVQMSAHVSQDHTFADRMGVPTSVLRESNFMPPQSFNMKDLISEMKKLETHQDSSIAMNHCFTRTIEADLGNLSFQPPRATHFYDQVPQAMCLPNQFLQLPVLQPEQMPKQFPRETNFPHLEFYDKAKYKVIHSLNELEAVQDTLEKHHEVQFSQKAEEIKDSDENNEDWLQKGKEFLAEGSLTDAILCFETAVEEDETCAEAWTLLGTSYSENLKEYKAIQALKRALDVAPENRQALMQLAVCYSNQYNKHKAYSMLIRWLKNHPEYKDIVPKNFETSEKDAVLNLFIRAAQKHRFNVDYEVQCALALICDLNHEYDKALDCIRAALQVLPNDARLWNRLGVLLCKNKQLDEAIDIFEHAIYLDPNYRLVHYNLAMIYEDKRNLREACKHFVILLNLQARVHGEVPSSKHTSSMIWMHFLVLAVRFSGDDVLNALKNRDLKEMSKLFGLTTV